MSRLAACRRPRARRAAATACHRAAGARAAATVTLPSWRVTVPFRVTVTVSGLLGPGLPSLISEVHCSFSPGRRLMNLKDSESAGYFDCGQPFNRASVERRPGCRGPRRMDFVGPFTGSVHFNSSSNLLFHYVARSSFTTFPSPARPLRLTEQFSKFRDRNNFPPRQWAGARTRPCPTRTVTADRDRDNHRRECRACTRSRCGPGLQRDSASGPATAL
jgi:hypothetical protein